MKCRGQSQKKDEAPLGREMGRQDPPLRQSPCEHTGEGWVGGIRPTGGVSSVEFAGGSRCQGGLQYTI